MKSKYMGDTSFSKWLDALSEIFKNHPPSGEIAPDFDFVAELQKQGIVLDESVSRKFSKLEPQDKADVLTKLEGLSKVNDSALSESRHDIFRDMSDQLERFFQWEEDDSPGWLI